MKQFCLRLGLFCVVFLCGLQSQLVPASGSERNEPLYRLDLSTTGRDGRHWLQKQGFVLNREMGDENYILIHGEGEEKGLQITARKPSLGLALKSDIQVEDVGLIELEWGVAEYPAGASWRKGVNREPLMVQLYFGPKVKADRFYLPDSPYFIGFFLCRDDEILVPYVGKSYRETGRYVCLGHPDAGEMTISSFDIAKAYRQWFDTDTVPSLTGIGIEVDTSDLQQGRSRAYLRRITMYRD